MSIQLILFGIFITALNILILYIFFNLISKKIDSKISLEKDENLNIKIELLKEQIKLSTVIIQNNSILISKNKKNIDAFEEFIKSALLTSSDEVIH